MAAAVKAAEHKKKKHLVLFMGARIEISLQVLKTFLIFKVIFV